MIAVKCKETRLKFCSVRDREYFFQIVYKFISNFTKIFEIFCDSGNFMQYGKFWKIWTILPILVIFLKFGKKNCKTRNFGNFGKY